MVLSNQASEADNELEFRLPGQKRNSIFINLIEGIEPFRIWI